MIYTVTPFTFDFSSEIIQIEEGETNVDCGELYAACREAQASEEGVIYEKIAEGSGLVELGPSVQVGLTILLLRDWQLRFPPGNYNALVAGGNLVAEAASPFAYSPGVRIVNIQSAASTVVSVSTGSGLSPQQAAQLAAIAEATETIEEEIELLDGIKEATQNTLRKFDLLV
jgi:cell division GTPase FtsZ